MYTAQKNHLSNCLSVSYATIQAFPLNFGPHSLERHLTCYMGYSDLLNKVNYFNHVL